jgi:hypothetical protein
LLVVAVLQVVEQAHNNKFLAVAVLVVCVVPLLLRAVLGRWNLKLV